MTPITSAPILAPITAVATRVPMLVTVRLMRRLSMVVARSPCLPCQPRGVVSGLLDCVRGARCAF